jgi:hypothetical protein
MIGGVRIVNVGSVGEAPGGDGTNRRGRFAHATWIESTSRGVHVEPITVPLDDAAQAAARA